MSSQRSYLWPVVVAVCGALLTVIALPQSAKEWAPGFLRNPSFHFGLDLAGGTQLDFRISERELDEQITQVSQQIQLLKNQGGDSEELAMLQQQLSVLMEQKRNVIELIRNVLERRINALGVSEATITPSYIGDEKHLLVECPGVVDVQECIETVGKTIKLEFKEEFTEATAEYEQEIRTKAADTFARIQAGESIAVIGQDLSDEIGVMFSQNAGYFKNQLPAGMQDAWEMRPGDKPVLKEGSVDLPARNADGEIETRTIPGVFIFESAGERTSTGRTVNDAPTAFTLLAKEDSSLSYEAQTGIKANALALRVLSTLQSMSAGELKTVDTEDGTASVLFLRQKVTGAEKMSASHILIAHKDAVSASEDVTRTKDEAKKYAESLIEKLNAGEDFLTLAKTVSDGPSKEQGGNLGEFGRGEMVGPFEQAAYALKEGEYSQTPIETQFGFHIIRSDKAPVKEPDMFTYDRLLAKGDGAFDKANAILAKLQRGDVKTVEELARVTSLFFSLVPTGWKDTPLDGKHFRSATVTQDPTSRVPVVQISFDAEGARIFQELTKRNVNKQLAIFVGGQLISAPVVQQEIAGGTAVISGQSNIEEAKRLANDLNTGAIPAPVYLTGQRTVEATLGAEALRESLKAGLVGILLLMGYMILCYRLLGLVATFSLTLYAFLFVVMLKLPLFVFSRNYIVLTVAGMAGVILSIGMAVDANILIFERIKEELRKGKLFKTAVHVGFEKAWPSIRDGNASTLITCAILFFFGTSIIRGFAITLILGLFLSMFTAIIATRWFVDRIANSPLANRPMLFGAKKTEDR